MKNFYYAFVAKTAIAVIFTIIKPSNWKRNFEDLVRKDTRGFCMFLATTAAVFKFTVCTLRRLRGTDDGLNGFIAGLLAGLSYTLETSKRRKSLLKTVFLCRAIDTFVTFLDRRKIIKKIKNFEVYMFGPVISFLVYLYFYEKALFPPGIDKAFIATARPTENELLTGSDIFVRQGIRWMPGKARKLLIK